MQAGKCAVGIVAFDGFTDLDVFLPWDLLSRVGQLFGDRIDWSVRLLGTAPTHVSAAGLSIPMHGTVDELKRCDVVLFASGPATRAQCEDDAYLGRLRAALAPERQTLAAQCSGALLLGALGVLEGLTATTYPTARDRLRRFGAHVVEAPFVAHGRVATAAGCLAGVDLARWIVERHAGAAAARAVLRTVAPAGVGTTTGAAAVAAL